MKMKPKARRKQKPKPLPLTKLKILLVAEPALRAGDEPKRTPHTSTLLLSETSIARHSNRKPPSNQKKIG